MSAVLISAASFVATYIQSEASLLQVKAETWPFLQIDHGNTNADNSDVGIYFNVSNAGVGPARIKDFKLYYDGVEQPDFLRLMYACCAYEEMPWRAWTQSMFDAQIGIITDSVPPIIPDGEATMLFKFIYDAKLANNEKWLAVYNKLDHLRQTNHISATACYCSLLDECYETKFEGDPVEVKMCTVEKE